LGNSIVNLAATILTSAVISAVIASAFGLIGQAIDRRARRRELLFVKSVELARENREFIMKVAKDLGAGARIHDYAVYAEMYFWLLTELHDKGHLPANWRQEIKTKFRDI
jgi:hypothetical protein